MVSREKFIEGVRITAFALHAIMAIVVSALLYRCQTQVYTNTGYKIIAVDWQVNSLFSRINFAFDMRFFTELEE